MTTARWRRPPALLFASTRCPRGTQASPEELLELGRLSTSYTWPEHPELALEARMMTQIIKAHALISIGMYGDARQAILSAQSIGEALGLPPNPYIRLSLSRIEESTEVHLTNLIAYAERELHSGNTRNVATIASSVASLAASMLRIDTVLRYIDHLPAAEQSEYAQAIQYIQGGRQAPQPHSRLGLPAAKGAWVLYALERALEAEWALDPSEAYRYAQEVISLPQYFPADSPAHAAQVVLRARAYTVLQEADYADQELSGARHRDPTVRLLKELGTAENTLLLGATLPDAREAAAVYHAMSGTAQLCHIRLARRLFPNALVYLADHIDSRYWKAETKRVSVISDSLYHLGRKAHLSRADESRIRTLRKSLQHSPDLSIAYSWALCPGG